MHLIITEENWKCENTPGRILYEGRRVDRYAERKVIHYIIQPFQRASHHQKHRQFLQASNYNHITISHISANIY